MCYRFSISSILQIIFAKNPTKHFSLSPWLTLSKENQILYILFSVVENKRKAANPHTEEDGTSERCTILYN